MDTDFFKNDNIFRLFAAWFCREWCTIYILLKSIFNLTSVSWGGVNFRVNQGGQTEQRVQDGSSSEKSSGDDTVSADNDSQYRKFEKEREIL